MHKKTFKYRIRPTKAQASKMNAVLEECRWLYNHLSENRQRMWKDFGESVTMYDQIGMLPTLKDDRPSLNIVHSQVIQNMAMRVDLAFQAFFRRVKAGEKPGYPRFKGRGQYDSFCYPQAPSGCKLEGENLTLSKIGKVRVIMHRPLDGVYKTVTIRRHNGKWFACFSCEVESDSIPASNEQVGIDVGLSSFATLSDGSKVFNPRFFRVEEKALAKAQRKLARQANGTAECSRAKKVVWRVHDRIANRRKNFAHQESRKVVNRFQFIAVEDLEVNRMVHNRCLSKSISDAAWSQFTSFLSYKAESAGRTLVRVNPAYTSQTCSSCGHRQKMPLSERTFACPCCSVVLDRDHNAALNIKALGLQSVGLPLEAPGFSRGE